MVSSFVFCNQIALHLGEIVADDDDNDTKISNNKHLLNLVATTPHIIRK